MVAWHDLDRFPFGDGPELADELLALILIGRKTATCWSADEGSKGSEVGKLWVVVDGAGRPRAVLRTVELTRRRFDEVDAAFAADEGEGDLTLAYWRSAHREYFTRNGGFAPHMLLWCERFCLVEILDAADRAG
ncbi:ASCH domain-containing protein [Chelatococcus reniformis]|uniref:RNA-binding protein n=1 Tax=Chelatococcus reniformis TaxID=1494448 RepID=A0A916U7Q6_9HYPH|nr:ASCH domain-containing protein [Chelatococcus reniformis]GGC63443.1 RNA-binding protein [Chelatococcus reniformis]